jgi:hypothetical protein
MVDAHRQRTYDAEQRALTGTTIDAPTSFELLRDLTLRVVATGWWQAEAMGRPVRVEQSRADARSSRAHTSNGTVRIARGQCDPNTLAHELAHLAAGPLAGGHDPRFRACQVALVAMLAGPQVAHRLHHEYLSSWLAVDDLSTPPDSFGPHGLLGGNVPLAPPSDEDVWLRRVQKLLAKADGTTNAAESEAFRNKAIELVAQHRLDLASLHRTAPGARATVVERQLFMASGPYVGVKVQLLTNIAESNGSKVFWRTMPTGRDVHVVGHPDDVRMTLFSFTSLATQALHEMHRTPSRGNTVQFRRSFLGGFANGVAERLLAHRVGRTGAHDRSDLVADAGDPHQLAPGVEIELHARATAVADYMRTIGTLRGVASRGYGADGYHAGRAAGLRSDLSSAPIATRGALGRG